MKSEDKTKGQLVIGSESNSETQRPLAHVEVVKPDGDTLLPRVMADSIKLQQVFSNLIMNARDVLDSLEVTPAKRLLLSARNEGQYVT